MTEETTSSFNFTPIVLPSDRNAQGCALLHQSMTFTLLPADNIYIIPFAPDYLLDHPNPSLSKAVVIAPSEESAVEATMACAAELTGWKKSYVYFLGSSMCDIRLLDMNVVHDIFGPVDNSLSVLTYIRAGKSSNDFRFVSPWARSSLGLDGFGLMASRTLAHMLVAAYVNTRSDRRFDRRTPLTVTNCLNLAGYTLLPLTPLASTSRYFGETRENRHLSGGYYRVAVYKHHKLWFNKQAEAEKSNFPCVAVPRDKLWGYIASEEAHRNYSPFVAGRYARKWGM